jgi:predicted O-linked N-acetylglucosamine transferase (SPINDLY family)
MDADAGDSASRAVREGITRHQAGDLAGAEAAYRSALERDSECFDALHLLGVVRLDRGNAREAVVLLRRALEREPGAYSAWDHLGLAYAALDDPQEAKAAFYRALSLEPRYAPAFEHLAGLERRLGNADAALRAFERAVVLTPEAAGAHNNVGVAYQEAGRLAEARAAFEKALVLDPNFATAAQNLGLLLRQMYRFGESADAFRRTVTLAPQTALAQYNYALACHFDGRADDALAAIDQALALDPEYVEARWAHAMLQLPLVHPQGRSVAATRAAFADALEALNHWFEGDRLQRGHAAVGTLQPFYLAYHDVNVVGLLTTYGNLSSRLMGEWQKSQAPRATFPAAKTPLRLAIVSGYVRDHSVWVAIARGICEHLDRTRVEVHLFHTGTLQDGETASARGLAERFVEGRRALREWVDAIAESRPHAILYPEVGMDAVTAQLAALRMAPLQMASWGHPMTTGLPTIDAFLSGAAFEPADGDDHYRERLVRLPGFSAPYRPVGTVAAADPALSELLESGAPVLLCAGTPYKYSAERDVVLIEIARRLGRAKFVFFRDVAARATEHVIARIERAFVAAGLEPRDFLVVLPRQSPPSFFHLLARAHVYLDTMGFSGFNTTMQAVECGLPVVAFTGRFMRGRLASGIVETLGIGELVTIDEANYVERAVRLCRDSAWNAQIRERISRARTAMYDDARPVRALEAFLERVTRGEPVSSAWPM